MIDISVTFDVKKVTRQLNRIERKLIPKATVTALNRTAKNVESTAIKEIAKETGIKRKAVKKQIKIFRAGKARLIAIVKASGRATNLIEFITSAKTNTKAFRKKVGVIAKAWGKKKEYRGTFIGTGKSSGKFLVYARTSKSREPIKAIYGPSVPATFIKNTVDKAMRKVVNTRFPIHFNQALRFYIGKLR